jgi:hypothetical protein
VTVKIFKDFGPNFGDRGTGCCITTKHRVALLFLPENFYVVSHPSYFFCFPIKDKAEVMEAESQAVLNTIRLQDEFNKRQNRWEEWKLPEGDYLESNGGQ